VITATQHNHYIPLIGPDPDTPEWYEAHRRIITATDIPAILGQSDYKTAHHVFLEKTGQLPPFEGNAHTRRGKRYEAAILADYSEQMGVTLKAPLPLYIHGRIPCLGATPDAQRPDTDLVEAKLTMSPARAANLGEEGTDDIPTDWLLQTQTQMAVMGAQHDDLAVLIYGRLRVYHVTRNEDLISIIEAAAQEMAERIANDDPPEPNWEHPRTMELMRTLHGLADGRRVILSEETTRAWAEDQVLGDSIKIMKAQQDAAKARVLHAMGDAAFGTIDNERELVRKQVNRGGYTAKPASWIELREKKVKS
jgi:putative phage-type endonuclease